MFQLLQFLKEGKIEFLFAKRLELTMLNLPTLWEQGKRFDETIWHPALSHRIHLEEGSTNCRRTNTQAIMIGKIGRCVLPQET